MIKTKAANKKKLNDLPESERDKNI